MVESLAVLGIILSMIRPPQQVQPQYHYQHPAQQYYQPQQQVPYYVPQQPQGNYQYQSPQPVGSPYGPQAGPQGYYYGQPHQASTYPTGG
jgi:hypothetical protein